MAVKIVKKKTKAKPAKEPAEVSAVAQDTGLPTPQATAHETTEYPDGTKTQVVKTEPVITKEPLAIVSMSGGQTINLGAFNSVKFTVGLSMPCAIDKVDDTYAHVRSWVDQRLCELQTEVQNDSASPVAAEPPAQMAILKKPEPASAPAYEDVEKMAKMNVKLQPDLTIVHTSDKLIIS